MDATATVTPLKWSDARPCPVCSDAYEDQATAPMARPYEPFCDECAAHSGIDYAAPHELDRLVPLDVVLSKAFSAASRVLTKETWTMSAKVECAAEIVARIVALQPSDNCRLCGGERAYLVTLDAGTPGVTATVPMCHRHARDHADRRPVTIDQRNRVKRRHCSTFRMIGMAKNWVESEVARADRENAYGVHHSDEPVTLAEESIDLTRGRLSKPYAAALRADALLAELGLDPTDPATFNPAYAAVRESSGATADEIAAELRVKPAALRKQVSRLATKVPSAAVYSADTHTAALHLESHQQPRGATNLPNNFDASNRTTDEAGTDGFINGRYFRTAKIERAGTGGRRVVGSSRYLSSRSNAGTRIEPGDRTPNIKGDQAQVPDHPTTAHHIGQDDPMRHHYGIHHTEWNGRTTAAWAKTLNKATAGRYAAAAAAQRNRAKGMRDLERDALRAAHGVPNLS